MATTRKNVPATNICLLAESALERMGHTNDDAQEGIVMATMEAAVDIAEMVGSDPDSDKVMEIVDRIQRIVVEV
ncbi:MAG: hypothetical protein OXH70_17410 [Acidobacteria bacterium]|nr:hypothetical protein [Acidobacteriota bacterium]